MPPVLWGCKPAAKIRTKCVLRLVMGPQIGCFFFRLKSGLNDPELIEQKPSKTYGLMPQSFKETPKNTKVRPAVDNGS